MQQWFIAALKRIATRRGLIICASAAIAGSALSYFGFGLIARHTPSYDSAVKYVREDLALKAQIGEIRSVRPAAFWGFIEFHNGRGRAYYNLVVTGARGTKQVEIDLVYRMGQWEISKSGDR